MPWHRFTDCHAGAGVLAARFGCRPVLLWSGALACLVLPALSQVPTPLLLALALFVFSAAIGTLGVAMNIQAVIVEKSWRCANV